MAVNKQPEQELTPEQIKLAKLKAQKLKEESMTKDVYSKTVKDNEKHLVHAKLDKPHFDSKTGEKKSVAYVQKFSKTEFEQFKTSAPRLGYTVVDVLWNPDTDK